MPDVKECLPITSIVAETNAPASVTGGSESEEHVDHDHEGHDHGFEWHDGIRIALVAVAAALVWFRVWEPFAYVSVIGIVGTPDRHLSDSQRSSGKRNGAQDDDGAFHDHRNSCGAGNWSVLHGAHHRAVCTDRRSARGPDGSAGSHCHSRASGSTRGFVQGQVQLSTGKQTTRYGVLARLP